MKKILLAFVSLIALAVLAIAIFIPNIRTAADKELSEVDDPDMPSFYEQEGENFDKEGYMIRRAEAIALRRGLLNEELPDPSARPRAIEKMELQEGQAAAGANGKGSLEAIQAAWTPIGPAPIPNGQTTPTAPVSGRTIAIAVHPTNRDIVYVGTAQGGIYRSLDGGMNWTPIFDSAQSLAVGSIAISPSNPEIVYVGTGEPNFGADSFFGVGVYRIDNASTTADLTGPLNLNAGGTNVFLGRAIGEIQVHPTNPDIIFVGSTTGAAGIRPFATGVTLSPLGLFRSDNATTANPTFTKLTGIEAGGSFSIRDMALDPQNPNNMVVNLIANGGGLYTTNNALNADPATITFTRTLQFTGTSVSTLTAELTVQKTGGTNGARTYYAATGFGNGRVYRSTNSGTTWTQQIDNDFCNGQCFYDIAIDVDPTNTANVYLGGSPNLIFGKSITSGTAFVPVSSGLHADTHAITVAPSDPLTIFLGTDGGIYKSTDSGVTFVTLNNTQFSATQFVGFDVHPTDPNFSLGGTQDNGTNLFQPTATWFRADFGDGGYAVIDQNSPDAVNTTMYHTYFNQTNAMGYAKVTNTAQATEGNWDFYGCGFGGSIPNGMTCTATAINFYAPMERGPGNPNSLYFGSDVLYRSTDAGITMTKVSQEPITTGVAIAAIGISPQNDNIRVVGLNNGDLFGTTTGSNTLVNMDPSNNIPGAAINRVIIDPNTPTTAYVALSTFSFPGIVYKTTNLGDTGTTWTNATGTGANALPFVPVDVIVVDPQNSNTIYAGTDIGVYVSTTGGASWTPFGTGLPRVAIFDMKITVDRMIRVATHGRGVYQIPALAPTAASVSVGGRVLDNIGRGISKAVVQITDQNGITKSVRTNQFGYYRFDDIEAGEVYTVNARHKRYRFSPQVVSIQDSLTNLNLTAGGL